MDPSRDRRARLAEIARREASAEPAGNSRLAGPDIEKYLTPLRAAMNRRAGGDEFLDSTVGFDWCGAFAYFCCVEAGFDLKPEPSEQVDGSLAAVRTWFEYATLPAAEQVLDRNERAAPGDIVLFDRLFDDEPFDHMGVIIDVTPDGIVTAEGNVYNRAGLFHRLLNGHINCLVRLGSGSSGSA